MYRKVTDIQKPFVCFLIWVGFTLVASNTPPDSLLRVAKSPLHDTNQVNALIRLAKGYVNRDEFDSSLYYSKQALMLAHKLRFFKGMGNASYYIGTVHYYKGNYNKAIRFFDLSAGIRKYLNDNKGIAMSLTGIGSVYLVMSDLTRSLQNQLGALRHFELAGDTAGLATASHNLGNICYYQSDFEKARQYYWKAYTLHISRNDSTSAGLDLLGIGGIDYELKNYEQADKNYREALRMQQTTNDRFNMAYTLAALGLSLCDQGQYKEGIACQLEALRIRKELGDEGGQANSYVSLADGYRQQGALKEALAYGQKGLLLASALNDVEDKRQAHQVLSDTYRQLSQKGGQALAAKSLDHFKKFIALRDSLTNEENTKKTVRLEMQYEFDKKDAATKLEQEKKDAVAKAEKRRQRIILFSISGFGVFILGFAIFAYRSFLQKKKANEEITRQKELIEEKQKEILDSILYARRIQNALMPHSRYIERKLTALKKLPN